MPRENKLYVHLCCEGWVRLGPFAWIGFDDERNAFIEEHGDVIAAFDGDVWRVPGDRYEGFGFRTPMITASPRHPSPMRGGYWFTEDTERFYRKCGKRGKC